MREDLYPYVEQLIRIYKRRDSSLSDIEVVKLLVSEGIEHYRFDFLEIGKFFHLSKLEDVISTNNNKFYLSELYAEIFIVETLI